MLRERHRDHEALGEMRGKKSKNKIAQESVCCGGKTEDKKLCYGFSCSDALDVTFPVGCAQGLGIDLSFIFRALALLCHPSFSHFGAIASLLQKHNFHVYHACISIKANVKCT